MRPPAASPATGGRHAIARLFADEHLRRFVWGGIAAVVIGWAYLSGLLAPVDRALLEAQYYLLSHDAKSNLTIVEIDPKSLKQFNTWPWPRQLFASAIERLTEAGARTIALDVDFSAHSVAADDDQLADAIRQAGGRVVLPVFQQANAALEGRRLVSSAPIDAFQRNARLATVTIQPARDGRIWWYKTTDLWNGWRLPTMAGLLADGNGGHGRFPHDTFLIDYSIRPDSFARISFSDLLENKFDPRLVAGKTVLLGGTAVELGDHFTVPIYTELPGVIIQALAYETLAHGTAAYPAPPKWTFFATFLLVVPAFWLFGRLGWRAGGVAVIAAAAAVFAGAAALRVYGGIDLDTSAPILGLGLAYLLASLRTLDVQALRLFTYHAEAVERRALMQSVVESSFDGIVIAEADGAIRMLNPSAVRLLGCVGDDAVGRQLQTLIGGNTKGEGTDPLGIEGPEPHAATLPSTGSDPVPVEITVCRARIDGVREGRKLAAKARPLYIYTIRDVAAYRAAAEAERRAREEAVLTNRAKTEFLANMSHELRTPLNAIIGFSEMMRTQMLGPIGSKQYVDYAQDIHSAGVHLHEVIDDILDVSRIELGKVKLDEKQIAIPAVVDSVQRMIADRAAEKGVALEFTISRDLPPLAADERSLKQMLLNLLNNAVKFTDRGGRVTVEGQLETDGALTIAVADTGIGIAPEHLPSVMRAFYQVESSYQRNYQGTGLGLAIVEGLVTLHGGSVHITSELGVGTRVALRFPPERVGQQRLATVA